MFHFKRIAIVAAAFGLVLTGSAHAENWSIFDAFGAGKARTAARTDVRQAAPRRLQRRAHRQSTWPPTYQRKRRTGARAQVTPVRQAAIIQRNEPYRAPSQFRRQTVQYSGPHGANTIVIDTRQRMLFHVHSDGTATRYGVGVGRAGFEWTGKANIARKAEWPSWHPPAEMRKREKARGRILPAMMPGGPNNPLGARALYLYKGGKDTLYRIHGTNNPRSIGLAQSSGCIRMMNEDVTHLYNNTSIGTSVVVR